MPVTKNKPTGGFVPPSYMPTNIPIRQFSGAPHHPHYHGFCHSCCHPISKCCCGVRGCRKESKELLVRPLVRGSGAGKATAKDSEVLVLLGATEAAGATAAAGGATAQKGSDTAIIGGGCCVHLSVEYMHSSETAANTAVVVKVDDSEGTTLAWAKKGFAPGYYIKEGIITTNPGATLTVTVSGAIARVRWCEVFSC